MDKEVTFTCENAQINTDLLYRMLPADQLVEMIKFRDKIIAKIEKEKEDLKATLTETNMNYSNIVAMLDELRAELYTFKEHYSSADEMLEYIESLVEEIGNLTVKLEKMKQQGITMDVIERAAYDIIQDYLRELDNSGDTSSRYTLTKDHAAVTVITTRMVERIKQYMKDR